MVYQGETAWIKATLTDEDGDAFTPASQLIILSDPDGALSTSGTNPTLISTAIYKQGFAIASDAEEGNWKVVWETTDGSGNKGIDKIYFKVESP